jgi:hypothetical protein
MPIASLHVYDIRLKVPLFDGKVKLRYMRNGVFSIPHVTPTGTEKQISFYHDGFRKKT